MSLEYCHYCDKMIDLDYDSEHFNHEDFKDKDKEVKQNDK